LRAKKSVTEVEPPRTMPIASSTLSLRTVSTSSVRAAGTRGFGSAVHRRDQLVDAASAYLGHQFGVVEHARQRVRTIGCPENRHCGRQRSPTARAALSAAHASGGIVHPERPWRRG
jgi:hypothetical protein